MKFSNLYSLILALPLALTPACSNGGNGDGAGTSADTDFGTFTVALQDGENPADLVIVAENDEQDLPVVFVIDGDAAQAHVKPGIYDIHVARRVGDADGTFAAGEVIRSFTDVEIFARQERVLIADEYDLPLDGEGQRDRSGSDGAIRDGIADSPDEVLLR